MKQFILVTDLDNTLIGDNDATLNLNEHLLKVRDRFYLFYATGRSFDSVAHLMGFFQLLTHQSLLTPDYLIASVGTIIYHRSYPEVGWERHIDRNWNRPAIARVLGHFPGVELQSDKEQNPWKLSFNLSTADYKFTIGEIKDKLLSSNLYCNLIFSSKNNLDITPIGANKGLAIKWLQSQLDIIDLPVLVCGDSGNDISMYGHNFNGVIVSNAQPELMQWYREHDHDRVLLAKSSYAGAILEALYHFNLLAV